MSSSVASVTLAELIGLQRAAAALRGWRDSTRNPASGARVSRLKGRGMEVEESRPYQPGDDIRLIDWRVTARTGRPYTKQLREERERPVVLWVDYRRPMFFATRGVFKSVFVARAAALLAWYGLRRGDRVGGFVVSESARAEFKPQRGHAPVLRLLQALAREDGHPASTATQRIITMPLQPLARVVKPGSLVFILSDFRGLDGAAESLSDVGRHSDVVLCFIHDPLEAGLPPPGNYAVSDGAGRRLTLHSGLKELTAAYAHRFEQRQAQVEDLAMRNRMRLIRCMTDEDPLQVLNRHLH